MQRALAEGSDIIVNTDADGEYVGEGIAKLVAPIVAGEADIVVSDRGVADNPHFGIFERRLQRLGRATVKRLSQLEITDAVSNKIGARRFFAVLPCHTALSLASQQIFPSKLAQSRWYD